MTDKATETFYDEILCKDIKVIIDMISSLSNSYRLLVGGAAELNHVALVHKHDAEEAIERADELGEIIDDLEHELKKLMNIYLSELWCKVEVQQMYNGKLSKLEVSKLIPKEIIDDLENKYESNDCDRK